MPRQMPSTGCCKPGTTASKSALPQPRHGLGGGAHTGENDVAGRAYRRGVGGHGCGGVEPLQGELQRGDVRAAGDDHDLAPAHSAPLVLGSSVPSRRIAWRKLRPTPLKHDSIMWCVFSPCTRDVQRRSQRLRQRPEEMRDEFSGQLADAFAIEASFPDEVGPARQIERDLRAGLVHRQQESVARDAAFVAERFAQRGAQRQGAIFHRMMLVDLQIAAAFEVERKAAVLCDLLEHVIEEAQTGGDRDRTCARQVDFDPDVGFPGLAMHAARAATGRECVARCRASTPRARRAGGSSSPAPRGSRQIPYPCRGRRS